jgi:hypothetical protein
MPYAKRSITLILTSISLYVKIKVVILFKPLTYVASIISSGRQQMANQEALIAEYSALRQEISGTHDKRMQFVGAALAVGAAFVAYGFQAQYSLAFCSALFILLSAMYYSASSTRHIVLVSTYLYAIVESKVEGLQWETMFAESRKSEFRFSLKFSSLIQICMFASLSIFCVFFTWLFLKDYNLLNIIFYSLITVILGVSFILLSIFIFRVSLYKYRLASISRWKKIEKDLYPAVTAIHTNS